jgi:hypothetical protein
MHVWFVNCYDKFQLVETLLSLYFLVGPKIMSLHLAQIPLNMFSSYNNVGYVAQVSNLKPELK